MPLKEVMTTGGTVSLKTMLTINLQGSAKGYLISSLVSWQRFDVKHYCVSIYCKRLRFESRFFEGHVLF